MPFITDHSWTPATHRRALAAWHSVAPATDSQIFGTPRKSKPRSLEKVQRYRPLLTFRTPPSGADLVSNWRTLPANDNKPPLDFAAERGIETIPSAEEIETCRLSVTLDTRREARLAGGKFQHVPRSQLHRPIDGDFEFGKDRDGRPIVIRLGRLHFSNGTNVERAYRAGPDGRVEPFAAKLPAGALRFSTEEQATIKGSAHHAHVRAANLRIADIFGFDELYEPVPSRRNKRKGRNYTRDKAQAMLAAAKANTPVMPPVRRLPDGLPLATKDLASIFISLVKRPTGRGSVHVWEDFAMRLDAKAAWKNVIAELTEESLAVLEAAMEAGSLADIGRVAVGASDSYAERAGRIALEAANDNLAAAIKKVAA